MKLNKSHREFIVNELKKITKEINLLKIQRIDYLKNENHEMHDYIDINIVLLENSKIMIEKAIINNYIEEL